MTNKENSIYKNSEKIATENLIRTQGSRLMNVKQVSTYLDLKERTIRDYVYKGKIPYIKLHKMVRFDRAKIDKWIDGFYSSEP